MAGIDIFTEKRKGQGKGQLQLKSTQKLRPFAFNSKTNSPDNHNIAVLFCA